MNVRAQLFTPAELRTLAEALSQYTEQETTKVNPNLATALRLLDELEAIRRAEVPVEAKDICDAPRKSRTAP